MRGVVREPVPGVGPSGLQAPPPLPEARPGTKDGTGGLHNIKEGVAFGRTFCVENMQSCPKGKREKLSSVMSLKAWGWGLFRARGINIRVLSAAGWVPRSSAVGRGTQVVLTVGGTWASGATGQLRASKLEFWGNLGLRGTDSEYRRARNYTSKRGLQGLLPPHAGITAVPN